MEKGQHIILDYFESTAHKRDKWKKRNKFYQKTIEQQFAFIIPEGSTVLELGCSTGDLLNAVKPGKGIGLKAKQPLQNWLSIRNIENVCLSVSFVGGINLLILGIIGEYLGKLFIENKRRPNYLISETNLLE